MTITITNTSRTVDINGVFARVWEGKTASGIEVVCCITRIAAPAAADLKEFERELQEVKPPTDLATHVFPSRMIL